MQIVKRKIDLQCVGTVASNITAEQEILLNVIPNFGGTVNSYEAVTIQDNNAPVIIAEPADEEKVWMAEALIAQESEIEELKARLAAAGL